MNQPRLLSNSNRSDSLLRIKLKILRKTLRVRGVEVQVIKNTNPMYAKVHGFNNIDLDGDRADETSVTTYRLVLNLNNLERVSEKGATQTVYHTDNIAEEGDIIKYRDRMFEYAFKVERKSVYGEINFIYEYELSHFRTIKLTNTPVFNAETQHEQDIKDQELINKLTTEYYDNE